MYKKEAARYSSGMRLGAGAGSRGNREGANRDQGKQRARIAGRDQETGTAGVQDEPNENNCSFTSTSSYMYCRCLAGEL